MFHVEQRLREAFEREFDRFLRGCRAWGVPLGREETAQFRVYHDRILEWNRRFRMISRRDEQRLPTRHFLDALAPVALNLIPDRARLLDIGSGAGLPGIPLAIVRPDMRATLVDSNRKRGLFLKACVRDLSLTNAEVVVDRVETLNMVHYDVVCARAVTSLDVLCRWSRPVLETGGSVLAFKGPDPAHEVESVKRILAGWGDYQVEIHAVSQETLPLTATLVKIGSLVH